MIIIREKLNELEKNYEKCQSYLIYSLVASLQYMILKLFIRIHSHQNKY